MSKKRTHFDRWLEDADFGDETIYHRGDLAYDRYDPDHPDRQSIAAEANAAMAASDKGLVDLYQQRANDDEDARLYLARRKRPVGWLSPDIRQLAVVNGHGRKAGYAGPSKGMRSR